jgi:type IV secretory pathway component VirB8
MSLHTQTHIINDNLPLQVLAVCLSKEQKSRSFFFLKKKWCAKIVRKVTRKEEGACSLLCLFVWVVTVAVAVLVTGSDDEPF